LLVKGDFLLEENLSLMILLNHAIQPPLLPHQLLAQPLLFLIQPLQHLLLLLHPRNLPPQLLLQHHIIPLCSLLNLL